MRALTMDEVECVGGGAIMVTLEVNGRRTQPDDYFLWSCLKNRSDDCLSPSDVYSGRFTDYLRNGAYSTRAWDATVKDNRGDYFHVSDIGADDTQLLYEQTSGNLYVIEINGTLRLAAQGYSGMAVDSRNNPLYENVRDQGPIPLGVYEIGKHAPTRGPNTMSLTPEWQSSYRTALLIHADNNTNDASTGCVILDSKTREQISNLSGATLDVVRNVPTSGVYLDGR